MKNEYIFNELKGIQTNLDFDDIIMAKLRLRELISMIETVSND